MLEYKNILISIFSIFLYLLFAYSGINLCKKQLESKNNKRLQCILNKTHQIGYVYYALVFLIFIISRQILVANNNLPMIRIDNFLRYISYIFIFKICFIDSFSMYYFNKHIK